MKTYDISLNGEFLISVKANHPSDFIHNIEIKRRYMKVGTARFGEVITLKKLSSSNKKESDTND